MKPRKHLAHLPGRCAIGVCLLMLFAILPLWGGQGGSISGNVTDPNQLAVSGATVTAINTATSAHQSLRTDSSGIYSFTDLAVGIWDVEVESAGFKTYRRAHIAVDTSSALRLDVSLVLGDRSVAVALKCCWKESTGAGRSMRHAIRCSAEPD